MWKVTESHKKKKATIWYTCNFAQVLHIIITLDILFNFHNNDKSKLFYNIHIHFVYVGCLRNSINLNDLDTLQTIFCSSSVSCTFPLVICTIGIGPNWVTNDLRNSLGNKVCWPRVVTLAITLRLVPISEQTLPNLKGNINMWEEKILQSVWHQDNVVKYFLPLGPSGLQNWRPLPLWNMLKHNSYINFLI